ncbi:hypothetical protein [Streptomyces sp. LBL]|uniref:hypothetical protein n=1 Tax=Streptomyces sp. LBL TaxID=2940562 RepID=UPI0032AF104A
MTEPLYTAEAAYRGAAALLDGCGMPGLESGLLPLALLCLYVRHEQHLVPEPLGDWGPYEPWVRPLLLVAEGREEEAARLLTSLPSPPRDLLHEALWCLLAHTAIRVGDRTTMRRAHTALAPAAGELAGAGSGLLSLGPVAAWLEALAAGLRHT